VTAGGERIESHGLDCAQRLILTIKRNPNLGKRVGERNLDLFRWADCPVMDLTAIALPPSRLTGLDQLGVYFLKSMTPPSRSLANVKKRDPGKRS